MEVRDQMIASVKPRRVMVCLGVLSDHGMVSGTSSSKSAGVADLHEPEITHADPPARVEGTDS